MRKCQFFFVFNVIKIVPKHNPFSKPSKFCPCKTILSNTTRYQILPNFVLVKKILSNTIRYQNLPIFFRVKNPVEYNPLSKPSKFRSCKKSFPIPSRNENLINFVRYINVIKIVSKFRSLSKPSKFRSLSKLFKFRSFKKYFQLLSVLNVMNTLFRFYP